MAAKFKFTDVVGSLTLLPYLHWSNSALTARLDLPPPGQHALQIFRAGQWLGQLTAFPSLACKSPPQSAMYVSISTQSENKNLQIHCQVYCGDQHIPPDRQNHHNVSAPNPVTHLEKGHLYLSGVHCVVGVDLRTAPKRNVFPKRLDYIRETVIMS